MKKILFILFTILLLNCRTMFDSFKETNKEYCIANIEIKDFTYFKEINTFYWFCLLDKNKFMDEKLELFCYITDQNDEFLKLALSKKITIDMKIVVDSECKIKLFPIWKESLIELKYNFLKSEDFLKKYDYYFSEKINKNII